MRLFVLAALSSGLLLSCQAPQTPIPSQVPQENFHDLETEYAGFQTQALTANYVGRKVRHWIAQSNGEGMRREMEFARLKHPALMQQHMAYGPLCAQALPFAEVDAFATASPDFGAFVTSFLCSDEILVNASYTTNAQTAPAIASDANGNFVVVWSGSSLHDSDFGISAQRYNTQGQPLGPVIAVNHWTTDSQNAPSIAMADDGRFVVTWVNPQQIEGNYDSDVMARRFAPDGTPLGNEFLVSDSTTGLQSAPKVAMAGDGRFAIVWQEVETSGAMTDDIRLQIFNAAGEALDPEADVLVNSYTTGMQYSPDVAIDDQGRFVVVWQSEQLSDALGVYAQHYAANGTVLKSEFRVNSVDDYLYTTGQYAFPSIAMAADGRFVVAWESWNQDGDAGGVFAQRFDSAAAPAGNEFPVNTYTTSSQRLPHVAIADDGQFLVSWVSLDQDGYVAGPQMHRGGVFAQRYDAVGGTVGSEFQVNTYTTLGQTNPHATFTQGGEFVITWQSLLQDGSGFGVYAHRYGANGAVISGE